MSHQSPLAKTLLCGATGGQKLHVGAFNPQHKGVEMYILNLKYFIFLPTHTFSSPFLILCRD